MKHKFPYKWFLSDGYPAKGIQLNNCKVFGTFVCGGGSTMGYKLAGFDHLGGVEIDPKVADIYKVNHHPKHLYIEDIRVFNMRDDIPDELYNLDILDGSPPCSSFSMAGNREKDWGKKRKFREGQELQRLDDLVFEYLKTIEKLHPKVALLENVKGMLVGNAKAYTKEVVKRFNAIGYTVQVFLLNAASMGVPQKRERVFFIGLRNDFKLPKLTLQFDEQSILFRDIFEKNESKRDLTDIQQSLWDRQSPKDKSLADVRGEANGFTDNLVGYIDVCPTITSGGKFLCKDAPRWFNKSEFCKCGSYPLDYIFKDIKPQYLIGMSVPPVMTAQIAYQIWIQWLSKIN